MALRHGIPVERGGGMLCDCLTCFLFMKPATELPGKGLSYIQVGDRLPTSLPSFAFHSANLGSDSVSSGLCPHRSYRLKGHVEPTCLQQVFTDPSPPTSINQRQGTEFTRTTLPARDASSLGNKNLTPHWLPNWAHTIMPPPPPPSSDVSEDKAWIFLL